jgi:uncharacterized coiled-coil protein SlyX
MNDEAAERLEKIESHLAHMECQYEQINAVVVEQARTLRKVQALQQKLAAAVEHSELERVKATNPKPPHYQ